MLLIRHLFFPGKLVVNVYRHTSASQDENLNTYKNLAVFSWSHQLRGQSCVSSPEVIVTPSWLYSNIIAGAESTVCVWQRNIL